MSWANYWLLYIDIDGFSARITEPAKRDRLLTVYRELDEHLRRGGFNGDFARSVAAYLARTAPFVKAVPELEAEASRRARIFSDSIFVFFDSANRSIGVPGDGANPLTLTRTAADLSQRLWLNALPHRGAIAYGECHFEEFGDVCVGPVIVSAVEWAKRQLWLGISVVPDSVAKARAEYQDQDLLVAADVPVKDPDSSAQSHHLVHAVPTLCINPDSPMAGSQQIGVQGCDVALGLERAFREAPAKAHDRYIATARLWGEWGCPRVSEIAAAESSR